MAKQEEHWHSNISASVAHAWLIFIISLISVADPHHLDAEHFDADPHHLDADHFDADPDSHFLDPDPTFYSDADPDPTL
jgi:hypothetical protein